MPPPPRRSSARGAPQLSAKKEGLVVDGQTYDAATILTDHQRLRGQQPDAILVWSGDFTSHIGGHCHFRARVESRGGRTSLRIGGMDRYLQSRSWYGFIPAGPAHVQGFWMYRLYLQTVAAELARLDPHARLAIAGPSQAAMA